jgi:hypothetical protein
MLTIDVAPLAIPGFTRSAMAVLIALLSASTALAQSGRSVSQPPVLPDYSSSRSAAPSPPTSSPPVMPDYSRRESGVVHEKGGCFDSCSFELSCELAFPTLCRVHLSVDDAIEVRGDVDVAFAEQACAPTTELAGEVTKLENHVLTGASTGGRTVGRARKIVRREEDYRKAHLGGADLELFDDGAPLVCLLAKNDRLEAEWLQPGAPLHHGREQERRC